MNNQLLASLKDGDYTDSDLLLFHYDNLKETVLLIVDYQADRIATVVWNDTNNPYHKIKYSEDRRNFLFAKIRNYKRTNVFKTITKYANNFKFENFEKTIRIEHLEIKKIPLGFNVTLYFFWPFGICEFICDDIEYSQEYIF